MTALQLAPAKHGFDWNKLGQRTQTITTVSGASLAAGAVVGAGLMAVGWAAKGRQDPLGMLVGLGALAGAGFGAGIGTASGVAMAFGPELPPAASGAALGAAIGIAGGIFSTLQLRSPRATCAVAGIMGALGAGIGASGAAIGARFVPPR